MPTVLDRLALSAWMRTRGLFAREERGAVMSEYGTLIFFVGITAFGILVLFGGEVVELFQETENDFGDARDNPAPAD